jgi:hypothetical protein
MSAAWDPGLERSGRRAGFECGERTKERRGRGNASRDAWLLGSKNEDSVLRTVGSRRERRVTQTFAADLRDRRGREVRKSMGISVSDRTALGDDQCQREECASKDRTVTAPGHGLTPAWRKMVQESAAVSPARPPLAGNSGKRRTVHRDRSRPGPAIGRSPPQRLARKRFVDPRRRRRSRRAMTAAERRT